MILELQAEPHRRIDEDLDGRERHHEPLGNSVERQLHFEAVFRNDQIPEAVLQHDCHFVRVFFFEALGENDARRLCEKRNVEVMFARQAALGDLIEDGANDPAHRILLDGLVIDHRPRRRHACLWRAFGPLPLNRSVNLYQLHAAQGCISCLQPEMKWRASVARCPPDRALPC